MALIAICCYDTIENGRSEYTIQTLLSLHDTVDFDKHRVFIIDNNSCTETKIAISRFAKTAKNVTSIKLSENIGTARAINLTLIQRKPYEVCIKMDNDIIVHTAGWADEMEQSLFSDPTIGIIGLKRDDVWQNPNHTDPKYRTTIETLPNGTKIEVCDDIMGTCTAFSHRLVDKIGLMSQPSVYGFDDVLYSVRSIAAGFKNAFLPHIKITHLDPGTSDYSEWKRKEAGVNIEEVSNLCQMYQSGKLNYYYG